MLNLFLTGATGFLGGKLIKNLLEDKQNEVFILVRNVAKAEALRDSFSTEDQRTISIKGISPSLWPGCRPMTSNG